MSDENRILEKFICVTCQKHKPLYVLQYDGCEYTACERCAQHYYGLEVTE